MLNSVVVFALDPIVEGLGKSAIVGGNITVEIAGETTIELLELLNMLPNVVVGILEETGTDHVEHHCPTRYILDIIKVVATPLLGLLIPGKHDVDISSELVVY